MRFVRIFLDASVLFSAAKSDGAVRELLGRLRAAAHTLCADEYVVAEARRNLEVKGRDAPLALEVLLSQMEVANFHRTTLPPDMAALLHEKDQPVLAAAIHLECGVLVTGDRTHFGALYNRIIVGVSIHPPRSLAEFVWRRAER